MGIYVISNRLSHPHPSPPLPSHPHPQPFTFYPFVLTWRKPHHLPSSVLLMRTFPSHRVLIQSFNLNYTTSWRGVQTIVGGCQTSISTFATRINFPTRRTTRGLPTWTKSPIGVASIFNYHFTLPRTIVLGTDVSKQT